MLGLQRERGRLSLRAELESREEGLSVVGECLIRKLFDSESLYPDGQVDPLRSRECYARRLQHSYMEEPGRAVQIKPPAKEHAS